jgi:hypothetical protein
VTKFLHNRAVEAHKVKIESLKKAYEVEIESLKKAHEGKIESLTAVSVQAERELLLARSMTVYY